MLQIHGVPISVHTRKVIVAAIEKGLPYELRQVVPVVPDSLPANWRAVSPTGLIPVISDGDFTLGDSAAICAYLERAHPQRPLYPAEPRALGRAMWFENYAGGTIFRHIVHPLFIEVFVQPNVNRIAPDQQKIDAVLNTALPETFGYLESELGMSRFLAGDTLSMGDVAVVSNLITFQYIGFRLDAARYPRLAALFQDVVMYPAVREAIQKEQATVQGMGLNGDCVRAALN
ncbi:glutathione S-transferase family protein [Roseateles saccharophilus]|uniref:Glutathione S-transferase n=1 Tax=Roseateles saccharophilus TaxID=304 RepID=A0A4R3UP01_ROSSA|nr:glutathione S-transferase family protein [Roseateles saccharophilus]MDG0835500.1 glutathione S-transferase family protein [Roseateles saccharophilus]TCU92692.1 glutathione S-transferase [Roseateles saccharophilus]